MHGHSDGARPGSTHRPTAVLQPMADACARKASLRVDLPIPGSPSISTSCGRPEPAASSAVTSACHSCNRSTNSVRGAATRSGTVATGGCGCGAVNSSVVSWARMRLSSSRSSGPGSRPSSSSSIDRAVDSARSASACRLLRYSARASKAHNRSRNGCSSTAVCSLDTASECRPSVSSTSNRSSIADSRSPSRRTTIGCTRSSGPTPPRGGPRHRARASSKRSNAGRACPEPMAARASATRARKRCTSICSVGNCSTYPGASETRTCGASPAARSGSNARRNREI